jgi:hypothetical protein
MGIFMVIGNVGGVQNVFLLMSALIFSYYSEISFTLDAILEIYSVKSSVKTIDYDEEKKLKLTFCDKIKLITGLFPIKNMQRLYKKGSTKLEKEMDTMHLFKEHKKHKKIHEQ